MTNNPASELKATVHQLQLLLIEHNVVLPRIEKKLDQINGTILDNQKRIAAAELCFSNHLAEYNTRDKWHKRYGAPILTAVIAGMLLAFYSSNYNDAKLQDIVADALEAHYEATEALQK